MKKKGEGRISDNSRREEILQKAGVHSAVFFMAFFIALVSASAFTPVDKTNAEDLSVNLQSGDYYLQMNTATDVTIDMEATRDGTIMIATNTPTLHTNCESAKMYMSFDNTVTSINNTGLYLDGDSEAANKIVAVSGTSVDPVELNNNSWGWAKIGGSFSEAEYYTTETNWTNAKFAQMPTTTNPVLIYELTGNTSHIEQNVGPTIYYGVKANTALTSGTYTPAKTSSVPAKVVYTVVGEGSTTTTEAIAISPVEGWVDGGDTVIISTDIYSSKSDSELMSDFTATIDGENCALTGVSRTIGGALNFQCTTPMAVSRDERVDVELSSVSFGRSWVLADGFSYIPTTFKDPTTGEPIRNMQDMTSAICAAETTPANTMKTSSRVASAVTANGYVPETILTDVRDGRTYQVRKLADGNCWMAQNLELTFYSENGIGWSEDNTTVATSFATGKTTLTSTDTDLHSVDSLDITSSSRMTFWATQKVANSNYGWDNGGMDGARSFSHEGYNTDQMYTVDTGNTNEYGQKIFTTASSGERQMRGGNLYNWTAATLGSGLSITDTDIDAEDSICPANWQLPTGVTTKKNTLGNNYSFWNLLRIYYGSVAGGDPRTDSTRENPSELTKMQNTLRSEPISMIVSGYYARNQGTFTGRDTYSVFWSASSHGISSLGGTSSAINSHPSMFSLNFSNYRGLGFSVRCVVR